MNEMNESIVKMAHDIALQNEINWLFYLILFGIVGVGSFIGSFINEYAKKRGQQLATKADLDEIHSQLKRSTEITEQVKSDIEHGVWRAKELEMLKREKLEQYMINLYETNENIHKMMRRDFFQNELHVDEMSVSKLSMLQKLYLPELNDEHNQFMLEYAKFLQWLANGQKEMADQLKNGVQIPCVSDKHMEDYPKLLKDLFAVSTLIEQKAQKISKKLSSFEISI